MVQQQDQAIERYQIVQVENSTSGEVFSIDLEVTGENKVFVVRSDEEIEMWMPEERHQGKSVYELIEYYLTLGGKVPKNWDVHEIIVFDEDEEPYPAGPYERDNFYGRPALDQVQMNRAFQVEVDYYMED